MCHFGLFPIGDTRIDEENLNALENLISPESRAQLKPI